MLFKDVIGNEAVRESLSRMMEAGRLGHAILLREEDGGGAFPLALALAGKVNCTGDGGDDACGVCPSCHKYGKLIHPDLHFVFPVSKAQSLSESEKKAPVSDFFLEKFRRFAMENPYFREQELYDALGLDSNNVGISVNEARNISRIASLRSSEGRYRTIIIYLPEKMNVPAANKLLKLLEEPPGGTLFLMISHKPERMLETIRSRCQIMNLVPLSTEESSRVHGEYTGNPEYASLMETLLEAGLAKRVIDTFPVWEAVSAKDREKQKEFCLYAESYIRNIFLFSKGLESLAVVPSGQETVIRSLSGRIKPSFYLKAFSKIDSALAAVEGNSNAKLNFCDLCNQLLLLL